MRFLYCGSPIPLEDLCDKWHFMVPARVPEPETGSPHWCAGTCLLKAAQRAPEGAPKCSTSSCWPLALASSHCPSVTQSPAISSKGDAMIFDYSLAGLVSAGLLFYLTYALLRPERF